MSFFSSLKIKFSSKFCKTRVNLAYTASKICSIMNSFIRELNETNEFIIITQIIHSSNRSRLSRMRFAESSGRAQPAKPEQEKRFSKTRIWWLKPFRLFLCSFSEWRDELQSYIVLSTDQHWSAARACLRHLMIALIWVYAWIVNELRGTLMSM